MASQVKISVVLETDSSRETRHIGLRGCLRGLARQTYPRALTELVVVDAGGIPQCDQNGTPC